MLSKINKILVFRSCCLGDVAMLTPVINNLHKAFLNAEIIIGSSKWIENILPCLPFISGAVIFDAPFKKNIFSKIWSTLSFIITLRKEKFDMAFLSNRHSFYGLILMLAGIKHRLGFDETKYLTHTAPYKHDLHFTDRHLEILTSNGIDAADSNLLLKPKRLKQDILKEYSLDPDKFIIGIFPFGGSNPGTQMDIKRWEYNKYLELVKKLSGNKECIILFFEGYIESEKINESFEQENIKKLKINFDLISACNIFMSGDTGPLYIAEGFGVSTLSIFGPTDADKIAPKSRSEGTLNTVIWHKPLCSPCYTTVTAYNRNDTKYWKGSSFICNTGTHECIKSVTVEEVYDTLINMVRLQK
jgi:ADP-heptose:LPS heptosyltransferase